jgi:hypothetical protein
VNRAPAAAGARPGALGRPTGAAQAATEQGPVSGTRVVTQEEADRQFALGQQQEREQQQLQEKDQAYDYDLGAVDAVTRRVEEQLRDPSQAQWSEPGVEVLGKTANSTQYRISGSVVSPGPGNQQSWIDYAGTVTRTTVAHGDGTFESRYEVNSLDIR